MILGPVLLSLTLVTLGAYWLANEVERRASERDLSPLEVERRTLQKNLESSAIYELERAAIRKRLAEITRELELAERGIQ